jgi:hypothetical protein
MLRIFVDFCRFRRKHEISSWEPCDPWQHSVTAIGHQYSTKCACLANFRHEIIGVCKIISRTSHNVKGTRYARGLNRGSGGEGGWGRLAHLLTVRCQADRQRSRLVPERDNNRSLKMKATCYTETFVCTTHKRSNGLCYFKIKTNLATSCSRVLEKLIVSQRVSIILHFTKPEVLWSHTLQ